MRSITLKNFTIGLCGGLVGAFLFLLALSIHPGDKLPAFILGRFDTGNEPVQSPTPTATPSFAPDFWERIASEASLSTVAVQVFKNNRIVRSGSGIVLSSDGLIVIPADLTYAGGIYQVLYEDKITKATITSFDIKKNLAIIKITNPEFNLNVSDFNTDPSYQSGQDILVVGKISDFSKPVIISQQGIISYVNGSKILLDTTANTLLLGAKVMNSKGQLVGMLYTRGAKSYIISSKDLDTFFREYLK